MKRKWWRFWEPKYSTEYQTYQVGSVSGSKITIDNGNMITK